MKKIICFIVTMFMVSSVFALRFGIEYLPWYFGRDVADKCENGTVKMASPDAEDFNSSWHTQFIENDEEFYKRSESWKICTIEDLVTVAEEESKKGDLVIHCKDNLFYVGVEKK